MNNIQLKLEVHDTYKKMKQQQQTLKLFMVKMFWTKPIWIKNRPK